MRHWSAYDAKTGFFSPKKYGGPDHWVPRAPAGFVPIEGDFDHLSQRFDLTTGNVIDWQPPRPDDDHEWSQEKRRWLKREDVLQREFAHAQAEARIAALEVKQGRRVRELLAESDPILKSIDQEIALLRADLLPQRPGSG